MRIASAAINYWCLHCGLSAPSKCVDRAVLTCDLRSTQFAECGMQTLLRLGERERSRGSFDRERTNSPQLFPTTVAAAIRIGANPRFKRSRASLTPARSDELQLRLFHSHLHPQGARYKAISSARTCLSPPCVNVSHKPWRVVREDCTGTNGPGTNGRYRLVDPPSVHAY